MVDKFFNNCNPNDYVFRCENGTIYIIPKDMKCCVICSHNTDIFYDYTNGPYMFSCNIQDGDDRDAGKNCPYFNLDKDSMTVSDFKNKYNL